VDDPVSVVTPRGNKRVCLEKEIMQGTVPGARRRGRPRTHGLDGQHQDVDRTSRGRVKQNGRRTEISGESTSVMWPTLGSRTAKEQFAVVISV